MKLRKFILGIVILLMLGAGTSGWQEDLYCDASTDCEIGDYAVNNTDISQFFTGQICKITVTNETNENVTNNVLMQNNPDGFHNYTINIAKVGTYRYRIFCEIGTNYGVKTGMLFIQTSVNTNLGTILSNQAVLSSDHDDLEINHSKTQNLVNEVQSNLTQGIVVLTSATETQIDNIEADTNEIQQNQSNFVTADLSALATTNQLAQNTSAIISRGDTAWITATGFETESSASDRYDILAEGISNNATDIKTNVSAEHTLTRDWIDINASNLMSYLSGTIYSWLTTDENIVQDSELFANISGIITHGDSAWITAIGFQTELNALSRFNTVVGHFNALANLTDVEVWSYGTKVLTGFSVESLIGWDTLKEHVWNATIREVTGGNTSVVTNVSAIATEVWSNAYDKTVNVAW